MSLEQNKQLTVLANPEQVCLPEILHQQVAIPVTHYGFDDKDHSGVVEVHKTVTEDVRAFFDLAKRLRFPIEKVAPASDPAYKWDDDRLMAANVSSGFNYRFVVGTTQVSLHGLGLAFDINPRQNPYIRYEDAEPIIAPKGATWDINRPGTLHNNHPLVELMLERGWEWGGNWSKDSGRIDYQHFQKPN